MGKAKRFTPAMTPAQRDMFLKVLGETGNVSEAALAAGVKRGTAYNLRRRDLWFARDWDEAVASAPERMRARAPNPLQTIKRSAAGRTQLQAVRASQWNARDDAAFFARLEATGNVSASARAIGRNPNTAWRRRRECPAFAKRLETALEDAEVRLEHGLVHYANTLIDLAQDGAEAQEAADDGKDVVTPVEASFALQVVKWLDARKAGKKRGARHCGRKVASIEEVRDEVIRRVNAIRRHRERFGPEQGGGGDAGPADA